MTPIVKKIHHVAYRCKDALETARWYEKHLGMKLVLSIAEDAVPSTGEPDPYMHIFLDAGMGNVLAFFELPTCAPMGRDQNTPAWTQHLALQVESIEVMMAAKARLEAEGIEVVGPTDHALFQSIYFYDPNGHRLTRLAQFFIEALQAYALGEQQLKGRARHHRGHAVRRWRVKVASLHTEQLGLLGGGMHVGDAV